jgi:Holliday junction DNA helicase RuvA
LSPLNLEKIKQGTEEEIYIDLVVKEKEIELYGFLTMEEMELYSSLKHISGVGPKTAVIFSEAKTLEKLKFNLENGINIPKGIGKKKLQKILLELTGKIKEVQKGQPKEDIEVYEALKTLGFTTVEIREALTNVSKDVKGIEERIKETLKHLY